MNKVCRLALIASTLSLPIAGWGKDAPTVDQLSQNGIQSAFQLLRRDYIRREDLTFEELNKAALQGLLERLDFGAELVSQGKDKEEAKPSVWRQFLAPGIAYLRPETFSEGEGAMFIEALKEVTGKGATHLILDLRGSANGNFDEAAAVLQCFISSGEVMFKMKQIGKEDVELFVSKQDTLWKGPVIALIDGESGAAAEAVAWCLQQRKKALLVGEKTRGATVRFTELALDDSTRLRYASAEMLLPDDSSLFKQGLPPLFPVKMPAKDKQKIFQLSREAETGMKPYVNDRVRARYNEAALVAGSNPELDDYVRKSKGQALPGDEGQLRDVVVQRALDMIRSEDFVSTAKINWNAPVNNQPDTPAIPKAIPAKP